MNHLVPSRSPIRISLLLLALAASVPGFAALTISGTPPQGTVGKPYNFSFTASGGTAPYTFSATSDVPGLTLGSTGAITGTPTVALQNYSVAVTVTDADASTASKTVAFQMGSGAPGATLAIQASLPAGNVGQDYFGTLRASGGTLPYRWQVSGVPAGLSTPGGVAFAPSIIGTPLAPGTFQLSVQVTDSASPPVSATATITLTIANFVISTSTLPSGTVGVPYSQTIQTTGGTGPYTFAGGPPPGLGLSLSSTGTVSGTPSQAASVNFNVQVLDSADRFAETTVSLTINSSGSLLVINTVALADGSVGAAYSQTISVSGGAGPYTFAITDGVLPAGLTLNSATGAITGTPTAVSYGNQFTVQVSDKNGLRSSRFFIITVASPPLAITTASLPAALLNSPYSQTLTTSGGITPVLFFANDLPAGFQLTPAGVLSGTPTTVGSFPITITVFDSSMPQSFASKSLLLVVNNVPQLTISPASPLPNGTGGTAYSQTFTAAGGTGPYTFSISSGSVPAGLSLSAAGVLSGTPTQSGTFSFAIQVKDSLTATGTKTFGLTINPGPPVITTAASLPDGSVEQAYTATLTATGGSGQFTFALSSGSSLPSGLQLSSTGVLAGTPAVTGTSTFTIAVTDTGSTLSSSKQFTLKVNGSPIVITTPATLPTATAGVPYQATFSATGGTGSGKSFTTSDHAPPGLAFDATSLSGTPTTSGSYTFTLTFSDQGSVPVSKTFTLQVNPAGLAITNSSPLPPGSVGTTYSQTLTAIAGAAPYTFAVRSGSLPSGLTLSPAGLMTGTPTAPGQFTFGIRVTDAASITASQDFTLTITAAQLSFTTGSLAAAQVGIAYSQNINASGGTQPYAFDLSSGVLPNGLTLSSTGTLTGTPASPGNFGFILTVTDRSGVVVARSFSIAVANAGVMISTLSPLPSGGIGAAYRQAIDAIGGAQPYTFAVTSGSLPSGLTLSTAGLISGSPVSTGSSNFTVTVTDSQSKSASMAFTLTISSSTDLVISTPSALLSGVLNSLYQQAISATGGSAPYTFSLISGALPAGLSLGAGGAVSGTPAAAGNFGFTIQVADSASSKAAKAFTIAIGTGGVVFATSTLPDGTIGGSYSQTLAGAGGTAPYRFLLNNGNLPPGLTLSSAGSLAGTPGTAGTYTFAIQLSDSLGATVTKSLSITISGSAGMSVSSRSPLPVAYVDKVYSQTLSVVRGLPPYAWSVSGGVIPPGLKLISDGVLSGSPEVAGTFNFTVRVIDYNNVTATATLSMTVALLGSGGTTPSIAALTNSASYGVGGVAPGEIVTLFGNNLGPATLVTATTTTPGMVDTTLANTRVLFDGIPAPLVYVSAKQTSAIVPYAVARGTRTSVQVEYKGEQSAIFTTSVVDGAPGLYSANSSGGGQGAILNQDYTVNSDANPAAPGSVVILYATGEGGTDPLGVDGKIAVDVLPRPLSSVTVLVGGAPAQVLYAGGAPGIVAGGMQINVQLPKDVPTGPEVTVLLQVGLRASQNFVTVAIR